MWLIFFIPLVALAIGSLWFFGVVRYRQLRFHNAQNPQADTAPAGASLTVGIVLALVFGLLAWMVMPNAATAEDKSPKGEATQSAEFGGSNCEKSPKVAETAEYGINDPQTQVFAATGGNLIGNGGPLDSSSATAAVKDLYGRTASNPKLTANMAYVMRLSGFTPKDETREAIKPDVAFLDARVASLVNDHKLWSQTRRNICIRLGDTSMDADPYKDRDLTEIATRVTPVEAEGVRLPVTNVVLARATQPDGVRLLWINREVDKTGERPQKFPIAVDVQYAWPVVVGEIPESAEHAKPPPPQQQQQNQEFQQEQEQLAEQRHGGAVSQQPKPEQGQKAEGKAASGQSPKYQGNAKSGGGGNATGGGKQSGTEGGKGGGSGSGCGNSGCGTGGGSGSGGGNAGCGSNCPGSGGSGGSGGGGTPTQPPGTHVPPTSPPPTAPPTTHRPPPTSPPPTQPPRTTVPPTQPPRTTVPPTQPPTTKAPDPGCNVPGFCD